MENVRAAGLQMASVEDLGMGGIFKLIVARVGHNTPLGGHT
jgi:hypothetical protein